MNSTKTYNLTDSQVRLLFSALSFTVEQGATILDPMDIRNMKWLMVVLHKVYNQEE